MSPPRHIGEIHHPLEGKVLSPFYPFSWCDSCFSCKVTHITICTSECTTKCITSTTAVFAAVFAAVSCLAKCTYWSVACSCVYNYLYESSSNSTSSNLKGINLSMLSFVEYLSCLVIAHLLPSWTLSMTNDSTRRGQGLWTVPKITGQFIDQVKDQKNC